VAKAISPDSLAREVVRSRLLLRLFTASEPEGVRVIGWRIIAFHLLFTAAAILAGVAEGTLYLPGAGRGVLDHYGFHAILLSAPILVWMLCAFVIRLASIIGEPTWFEDHNKTADAIKRQHELIELVLGREKRGAVLLALMRLIGIFAVIANASNTCNPELVYGQDVFDSIHHPIGYVVGRIFLTYCWAYALPLLAYFIAMATIATVRITKLVEQSDEPGLRCFAADGCGGFRVLGSLMNSIVYMFVPIALAVVALSHTHANFYPLLKLSIVLALLIPAQLFLPFIRLHYVMVLLKQRKLSQIEKMLTAAERALPDEPRRGWESRLIVPCLRLLAGATLYQQASEMTTWPYVRKDALKWVTPFVPLVVSTLAKNFVL
jgi:hypothetical protein